MSEPDPGPNEFEQIARLFRPLTRGAPEALDLLDDAAVIPSRPGFDLVVTKDVLVAGVHFLANDPPELIARKLLRVNLSDLAAKGAKPYGYFLGTSWSPDFGWPERQAFASGLALDGEAFDLRLLGGDTVSTTGPLTVSATMLGWVASGKTIRRGGAHPGDLVMVSGTIGDGGLAWLAAVGKIADADGALLRRYQLPVPRLDLIPFLLDHANAAADVSDGLIADSGHIARASHVGMRLDLSRLPLSSMGKAWLAAQSDRQAGLLRLSSLGDDYEIVCTTSVNASKHPDMTVIGEVTAAGFEIQIDGMSVSVGSRGWLHT